MRVWRLAGRSGAAAPEHDHAAHRPHEREQEHEPEPVDGNPERDDDAAQGEALEEERDADDDGHPAEPSRQRAAPDDGRRRRRAAKRLPEDVPDAVEREGHQVERVADARVVLSAVRRRSFDPSNA